MTIHAKLYLYAAAALLAVAAAFGIWSHFRTEGMERAVRDSAAAAESEKRRADRLETETHVYKEKAAYLEKQLAEIRSHARKQDEELKKLSADTDSARRALQRARTGANRN